MRVCSSLITLSLSPSAPQVFDFVELFNPVVQSPFTPVQHATKHLINLFCPFIGLVSLPPLPKLLAADSRAPLPHSHLVLTSTRPCVSQHEAWKDVFGPEEMIKPILAAGGSFLFFLAFICLHIAQVEYNHSDLLCPKCPSAGTSRMRAQAELEA